MKKMSPEALADVLRKSWDGGPPQDSLSSWTHYFGKKLGQAAPPGFRASGRGTGNKEYLVDHAWRPTATNQPGLLLAAEFEWSGTTEAIRHDIVKLVDVRAAARIFLGNLWGRDWRAKADGLARETQKMLKAHKEARSDWLLLALGPKGRKAELHDDLALWLITRGRIRTI